MFCPKISTWALFRPSAYGSILVILFGSKDFLGIFLWHIVQHTAHSTALRQHAAGDKSEKWERSLK